MNKPYYVSKDPVSPLQPHSPVWIAQVWVTFGISILATTLGIAYVPVDLWMRGFLIMGMLFTIGSTLNIAKTTRDSWEAKRLLYRVDEARLERLLKENESELMPNGKNGAQSPSLVA